MTELDEWLRRMEKRMEKVEVSNGKLERLEEMVQSQFKSVELNINSMAARMDTHFMSLNGTVGRLREAEIRRDEREKNQKEMMAQVQTNMRWYALAAIALTGVLSSVLTKVI